MTDKARRLVALYQQMYELTEPECRNSCRCPQSCCSPEYCNLAKDWAEEKWGVYLTDAKPAHPKLMFMGPSGCIAAPHLRPLCTLHTCDMGAFGGKMRPAPDRKWDRTYWEIRNEIDKLESQVKPEDRTLIKGVDEDISFQQQKVCAALGVSPELLNSEKTPKPRIRRV